MVSCLYDKIHIEYLEEGGGSKHSLLRYGGRGFPSASPTCSSSIHTCMHLFLEYEWFYHNVVLQNFDVNPSTQNGLVTLEDSAPIVLQCGTNRIRSGFNIILLSNRTPSNSTLCLDTNHMKQIHIH